MEKTLLEIAKDLGIENAEALTAAQLKKAVAAAQAKLEETNTFKKEAEALGIDLDEYPEADWLKIIQDAKFELEFLADLKKKAEELGITIEGLTPGGIMLAIRKEEERLQEEKAEVQDAVLAALSEYLGIDIKSLDVDGVKAFLAEKETKEASTIEVVSDGKTDKAYKASNGIEYGFSASAPGSFRFMGIVKTQEEWISDHDAMDLMVSGNLSYVKPLKK